MVEANNEPELNRSPHTQSSHAVGIGTSNNDCEPMFVEPILDVCLICCEVTNLCHCVHGIAEQLAVVNTSYAPPRRSKLEATHTLVTS